MTTAAQAARVVQALKDPGSRRAAALCSPVFFDCYYCGMRRAKHRTRWLTTIVDSYMAARESRRTLNPTKSKVLLLAPRDHGKTELAISIATMLVCVDRDIRILFISESQGQAVKRLARIKALLSSPKIIADWTTAPERGYGPFLPAKRSVLRHQVIWDSTQIRIMRNIASVDPTIEAIGLGGAATGGHFDVIVMEDCQVVDNVYSPLQRMKQRDWKGATIQPMLAAGGLLLEIGTRKHADDMYAHSLRDPTYHPKIVDQAIIKGDPSRAVPILDVDELGFDFITGWDLEGLDYEVLWPEERPIELLLNEYASEFTGPRLFASEYQNEIVDDKTALFPRATLDRARDTELRFPDGSYFGAAAGPWPDRLLVVQAWDPAFTVDKVKAETRDSDYQVGITYGVDPKTRIRYLLGMHRERGSSYTRKRADVIETYEVWAIDRGEQEGAKANRLIKGGGNTGWDEYIVARACVGICMEKNSAGNFHKIAIGERADIPLYGTWTGPEVRDPIRGVPMLATLFEQDKIVVPYGDVRTRKAVDELLAELHSLGVSAHKDTVLALWIAESFLREQLIAYERWLKDQKARADLGMKDTEERRTEADEIKDLQKVRRKKPETAQHDEVGDMFDRLGIGSEED